MIAEPPPPPSTPSVFERVSARSPLLIARDVALGIGFLVIFAGSLANIAHFVESRSSEDRVATSVPAGNDDELAGASSTEVASPIFGAAQPSATATSGESASDTPPVEAAPGTYVVARGDVLYKIAVQHGTTPQVLAELNGLSDPNVIEVGQVLRLPEPAPGS